MDIFEKYGLKKTKNRKIIYSTLKELNEPISCEELHKIISKNNNINLATIYRNLNTLVNLNVLDKIIRKDGIAYYFITNSDHHHYMVCDICKRQLKLDTCPIDISYLNLINGSGFMAISHTLEIHGICKECQSKYEDSNSEVGD